LYQADSAAVTAEPLPLARSAKTQTAPSSTTTATQQQASTKGVEEKTPTYRGAATEESDVRSEMNYVPTDDDDFGFWDFVDLVNPLHHIPIVGTLYRELSGDTIKPEVQVAGDVLVGVATGSVLLSAASSIASVALEQSTGKEPTVMVANALFGDEDKVQVPDPINEPKVVVADASSEMQAQDTAPPPQAAPQTEVKSQLAEAVASIKEPQPTAAKAVPQLAAASVPAAQVPLAAQTAQTGSVRMGNVIYTSPLMNNAARVQAPQRTAEVTPVSSEAGKVAATADAPTTKASVQESTTTETAAASQTADVALQMQQQAQAKATGNPLPPQLIQDLMLKALDKYQTAHNMGTSDAVVD
jgi:hypothetical protein